MPQAYSDDLRRKLLEAYEAGAGSLRELATRFRVSWGYTKKIRGQQLRTGQKERPVQSQHGPASRVTAAVQQQLRAAVRQQPDVTLLELQQRVQQGAGVWLSKSLLWLWLQRLELRRKKNPSTRRNKTRAKTSGGGKRGGNR
jgi:transposase